MIVEEDGTLSPHNYHNNKEAASINNGKENLPLSLYLNKCDKGRACKTTHHDATDYK